MKAQRRESTFLLVVLLHVHEETVNVISYVHILTIFFVGLLIKLGCYAFAFTLETVILLENTSRTLKIALNLGNFILFH